MHRLLFDTESDGFVDNATKVHCVVAGDVDTQERMDWKPHGINAALEALDKADVLIGHNIQRHDLPLLAKLYNFRPRPEVVIRDTMICARVIYPNVKDTDKALIAQGKMPAGKKYAGKHTLGSWGYRLGVPKGDYAEEKEREANALGIPAEERAAFVWGQWTPEMHEYALGDRETNTALWDHLRVDKYSQDAIELEHRIAFICSEMEKAGVPFNVEAAERLHVELIGKRDEVERRLAETFGRWYQPVSPDPEKSLFTPKKDSARLGYTAGAPMTKLKLVEFNPGSRDHIARLLAIRGWKPEKFTDGGKPQIDEETVAGIVERYPEFSGIGEYLTVEKRISQLATGKQAWLKTVDDKGLIHGVINPMGTGTSRASHFLPNLGQVPAVKSPYGKECRGLFYAPKGWSIVGADQQGLELRGLAHYLHPLDGGKYSAVVLNGDPHWMHAVAMGLADGERDKHSQLHTIVREDGSKRFIYAYIYGCGDGKAGEIIFTCVNKARLMCGTAGEVVFARFFPDADPGERALRAAGKKVRNDFATKIDGFARLKHKLSAQVSKYGWVPGLDGRRIPIRSEHSALNYMIQSCGAIICKRWVVDSFFELIRRGYKHGWNGQFVFGLWVHDEVQVWVREGLEKEVAEVLVDCARKSGEPYGFRVPLDSEAKEGKSWAETH
jgi:DNA polymerase I